VDEHPQMRSGYFKQGVKALSALPAGERERILSAVKAETLAVIERDVDVGWVDLGVNADFTEAVYRVVGARGTRAYGRRVGNSSFETPILRSMMEAAIRLFGVGPAGLYKLMRRSWSGVYRNCGEVEVEARPGNGVHIVLHDAPELMRAPPYLESISGGLEAIFDFCSVAGEVRPEPRRGGIEWTVTWKSR
jgi:hypothetical protein